jgi:hypothetical protein
MPRQHIMAVVLVFTVAACARRPSENHSSVMPHPGGCYVLVFDHPQLTGAREFINGPEKYYTLRNLPFGDNWRKRIRSVAVGPGATATLWTDEGFEGASIRLRADLKYPTLAPAFDKEIESLVVACTTTAE